MTIGYLITLTKARLAELSALLTSAERVGDVDRIAALNAEISTTQQTLDALLTVE